MAARPAKQLASELLWIRKRNLGRDARLVAVGAQLQRGGQSRLPFTLNYSCCTALTRPGAIGLRAGRGRHTGRGRSDLQGAPSQRATTAPHQITAIAVTVCGCGVIAEGADSAIATSDFGEQRVSQRTPGFRRGRKIVRSFLQRERPGARRHIHVHLSDKSQHIKGGRRAHCRHGNNRLIARSQTPFLGIALAAVVPVGRLNVVVEGRSNLMPALRGIELVKTPAMTF